MMTSSLKVERFEPFGKSFCRQHPFAGSLEEQDDSSLKPLANPSELNYKWKLRSSSENPDCYEELFVQKNTVVWSGGKSQHSSTVQKCYTTKTPVVDCLWCSFILPSANSSGQQYDTTVETSHSLCVVQNDCIDVLTKDGALFTITLPFPVSQVIALPEGLLLERTPTPGEITGQKKDVPTMFSVLHPLDEPRPITSKIDAKVSFFCDPTVSVVFCCSDPHLVLTYDSVIGLHSLWEITKAKPEECPESPGYLDQPPELHLSHVHHYPTPVLSAGAHSRLSVASPSLSYTPTRSRTPVSISRTHSQSPAPMRFLSPSLAHLSLSRIMSPVSVDSPLAFSFSRSPLPSRSSSSHSFLDKEESPAWDSFQPLLPEICLNHVWQETQIPVRYGAKGKASKAFLTKDQSGSTFLCYLLSQPSKLRGVQIISEGKSQHFCNPLEIPAKDAVPLERLNMMLVLDPNGALFIYSSFVKGCQVNLPNFHAISGSQELPGMFSAEEKVFPFSSMCSEQLDMSMDIEVTDTEEKTAQKLKPEQDLKIASLRDPISSSCNLVLTDGSIYRAELPAVSQNLAVTACLEALKCVLPASLVVEVHVSLYSLTRGQQTGQNEGEWALFSRRILEMMGLHLEDTTRSDSPCLPAPKKSKTHADDSGNKAWEMLMKSEFHKKMERHHAIGLLPVNQSSSLTEGARSSLTDLKKNAPLHQHVPTILFAWHLIYEDMKLNVLGKDSLFVLAQFLHGLAVNLGWRSYEEHYSRDFPSLVCDAFLRGKREMVGNLPAPLYEEPPGIIQWLYEYLSGNEVKPFQLLPETTKHIFNVIMLYSLFVPAEGGRNLPDDQDGLFSCVSFSEDVKSSFKESLIALYEKLNRFDSAANKVAAFLAFRGLTCKDLECLPFGVSMPVMEALHQSAVDPPLTLPVGAYELIGRQDLASMLEAEKRRWNPQGSRKKAPLKEGEIDDGFHVDDEVLSLRFGKDLRVQEIRGHLQSSKPVTVSVIQKPEVSDHDFIQEQENRLLLMCKRTMALPVGRGMFTMATFRPVLTETLPIPPLDLTGRALPRNTTVGLEHVETPVDMKMWPLFHNGVAAGLRIAQGISQVDSTWIVYNKPRNSQLTEEHAGFLMALGLSGHLNSLSYMNLHDYLCKGHELTTVGLLLGTAAAKRGTMDATCTRVLSIHIDALLPPTSAELDLPHSAQVAAILGIGLVYQGTAQRRMAEVLLSEIGRPPGPEMENAVNRESYSLAAGLALGLVMLEHGNEAASVADLKIADQLYHYMVGGQTKPQTGTQKEKFKSPSYQIKEGDSVNINITGPGATVALGLMFMKTNNTSVAAWLDAPDTQFLLDFIRPDFLLLRLLSRGLIMWDSIHPSTDWVESHIPEIVQKYDSSSAEMDALNSDMDVESLSQAKVNIIAGCCMVMGLRFAGSANQQAFNCLMHYTKYCKDLLNSCAVEQPGKPTVETCLDTILLSLAMVMAGTGHLDVLRIARQLRKRHTPDVSYGSHMAVHMAIGLLFLGGGRFTLGTSGPAVAALVCAFYPRFPVSSTDNRYHLQAFRHLYVLAAEPRVLVPREVDSNKACHVPLEVTMKESQFHPEAILKLTAPCILPELHLIKTIRVAGVRYWPITIDFTKDNSSASLLASNFGTLFVKRRTGFLPYVEDPKGHRNILAKTFAAQTEQIEVVRSFSSDPNLIALAELFDDKNLTNDKEKQMTAFISASLVECVTEEKPDVLKTLLRMWQIVHNQGCQQDPSSVWQMKLALTFYKKAFPRISRNFSRKPLISEDLIAEYQFLIQDSCDRIKEKRDVHHSPMMPQEVAELKEAITALLKLQAES
ncbi:anaphase-promoting complex subunit 1-like isoform X2 [Acropora millepora]|uniref:anaphase-promoting complex subunit 1-like isoform X2 n=1 Tax=Acropora millepora TaxID=45264 RepID=UPI001CF3BEC4|nr:anaphase-promoting complex subunit 1-like isoform X2 [Acropora millepora]